MADRMRLADLPVGSEATVCAVAVGEHGQGHRLEDLGLIVGTTVRVERRAPMGDPTVYEVRRARLAMRRADAELVEVELIGCQPAPAGAAGEPDVAL